MGRVKFKPPLEFSGIGSKLWNVIGPDHPPELRPYDFMISRPGTSIINRLVALCKHVEYAYKQHNKHMGVLLEQRGVVLGFGWNGVGYYGPEQKYPMLRPLITDFTTVVLQHHMFVEFIQDRINLTQSGLSLVDLLPVAPLIFNENGSQVFFQYNHASHKIAPPGEDHGEPGAMVFCDIDKWRFASGMISCRQGCVQCKADRCHECKFCCMGLDPEVRSLAVFVYYQCSRTPLAKQAFLCVDSKAYSMAGGLLALVDTRKMKCGAWAPKSVDADRCPWYGFKFIKMT